MTKKEAIGLVALYTVTFIIMLTGLRQLIAFASTSVEDMPGWRVIPLGSVWLSVIYLAVVGISFLAAAGLWFQRTFKRGLWTLYVLAVVSLFVSLFHWWIFRQSSCSFGLFGDDPYLLMLQKLIILGVILLLHWTDPVRQASRALVGDG